MSKPPYFSQYVSPNIVIVPTECYYGPPKPKQDRNVHQNPDSSVENCLKPDSFKIPNLPVKNQSSENSATNQELKKSMQTHLQNEVPKSVARDVNINSSAVDNNLVKTTKQGSTTTSWASNYLLSIGQLHKKNIKLNLSEHRKKGLTLREPEKNQEDTSACTAGMNSKETKKTSSIINDKERWTAITMNYKIPLKTSAHPTPKYDSKESKMSSEKTETIVNQISTASKHTKPPIKCDSKNITHRNKITEHVTQNSDSKGNTENLKICPEFSRTESNRKAKKLTLSCRRNSEWKNEEKHEKDINKTKSKNLYSIKNFEIKNKDKPNPESTMTVNTSKPEKNQDSENNKSRHMSSASKSSSTKPLKISNFFLNADTEKNLGASKRSKSSKISRGNEKEDKYVKNRKGSTKNKKDHPHSSTKKSLEVGIKKKYKKCKSDKEKKSKSKSYNLKPSTFSRTIKDGALDDHRSSSKDSIKSVVQLTDNSLHHKHKIDENFDLRTKLSRKGLNHYFTKIHKAISRYRIPNENRENLIITVQNENDDDNERKDLKNVHGPSNDDDNERMVLKNVKEPSPHKDSKDISVSREYKKIKLVINLICQQPSSHKPDKNENCGLTNEDLSFLDDFNVDEIVETLKHCENESIGAKHNVELDIEVHAGLEKTNPVSLDIHENKINYSVPEATGTIVRSRREFCGNKCTANPPQKLSHQTSFVKIEKLTNDDTLIQGTIQETNSKIDIPDTLHNENINCLHEDDDNASDVTLVLSPPHFGDFSLIDLTNELDNENVSEIENHVKNGIETTGKTAEKLLVDLSLIDSSNELSIENVSVNDIENYVKKEIETTGKTAEILLDDLSLIDSSNELSIEKVDVSEIENYVKKEIETTGKTAQKLLDDLSLNDSSNELSIDTVSVIEIENYVKKEKETTGKCAEKLLDDLNFIDSSQKLIEKDSNVESHLDTEMKDIGSTQNIPPDSVTNPTETTEHTKSFVSNTPNATDASKTLESGAFSNTIKSEGSSNLEKCGKRKNEDPQNESKAKILKVEDCVSNTSVVSVCDKKEQKDEKQQSKMSQSEIMGEPDKLLAQKLEQRMLSYLCEQYTVTSVIHKGTFSDLFHCKNSYGKDFAVKVINSESNRYNLGILKEKMLMKIQQEIPKANYNCIHIYNGFSLTGSWCFLMEYYPVNLMQAISKKKRPFHINAVQSLATQLVAAVTVLRNYKIVHADICPRHILLNPSHNRLKLCGFDGSYYIDCAKLVPNIGTVSYRAPEVILGFSAGYSIDVWSTALVIYQMATGKKLFPGCFNNDILYKQMCTLGNIPDDMVKKSLYKYNHYSGLTFVRKVGPQGKKLVYMNEFFKSNRLRSTILNQYKRYICNPSMLVRRQYCDKLETLCGLLEGMLVLHPNHRLAIEFVYSHPFIFEHFL